MKLPHRRQFLHLIAGAATVALVMSPANHEAWSQATRPIRIVVPYPPGGGADILARLLADQIGRTQGQTLLVENRAGAGSAVGTEAVARATPDGSTLLINTATIVIGPHLNKPLRCAGELRAGVPACDHAIGRVGQQRFAIPHIGRLSQRGAGKTR
jgi:hypothetical protein